MTDWPTRLKTRAEVQLAAAGYVSASDFWLSETSTFVATAGTVYGRMLGLLKGDLCTGVVLRGTQTAVGTLTNHCRVGLADKNGVMLVVGNLEDAVTTWQAGPQQHPFSSPYVAPADDGYYVVFVVGTFATQMPGFRRGGNANDMAPLSGFPAEAFQWAGQTDLPSVGASLTLTTNNSINPVTVGIY